MGVAKLNSLRVGRKFKGIEHYTTPCLEVHQRIKSWCSCKDDENHESLGDL